MNTSVSRNLSPLLLVLVLIHAARPIDDCAAQADELDLRAIKVDPEPLTRLHPALSRSVIGLLFRRERILKISHWVGRS